MTSDKSTTKNDSTAKLANNPSEGASTLERSARSDYRRGENQKPVNDSYTDNWSSIFGKKTKKKKTKKSKR
jgi:hypothetical protein